MEKEVEEKFSMATRMVGRMSDMVQSRKELSKSIKLMPSLLYGCEVWNKAAVRRVQASRMNVLRRVQRVRRMDRMRNRDIRQ